MILFISDTNIRYEESTSSKSQNFLDSTVSISSKNTILLQLYSKDTASGSYLHPFSTHPCTINAIYLTDECLTIISNLEKIKFYDDR